MVSLQRTVGNSVVSSLIERSDASIQRHFRWRASTIDSEAKLDSSSIDRSKLGSADISKLNATAKKTALDERWSLLVQMAQTTESEGEAEGQDAQAYQQLKSLIGLFRTKLHATTGQPRRGPMLRSCRPPPLPQW